MMNYEMFKKLVEEQFLEYMPEMFKGYSVCISPVAKTNQTLDGLSLIPPGTENRDRKIFPVIYINHMYERYLNGDSFQEALGASAADLVGTYAKMSFPGSSLDFSDAGGRIVMALINTEQNREMLGRIPSRNFCDLSIVYRYLVGTNENGIYSIPVDDRFMERIGMTEQKLYEQAVINTKNLLPPVVERMDKIMREMFIEQGMPEEIIDTFINSDNTNQMVESMYVISNTEKCFGAVSMLFGEELHSLSESVNQNLYILPSSIHEVIAVPASVGDPDELARMVADINMEKLSLGERLSNQVYYYDRNLRTLTLATDTPNKRLDCIMAGPPAAQREKPSR